MANKSNKMGLLNSSLTRFFLGSLLMGLPLLTTLEAKADMYRESMPKTEMGTENDAVESENMGTYNQGNTTSDSEPSEDSGLYNETDAGYDGEPIVTVVPAEGTVDVLVKNNTNAAIDYQAIGYTENQTLEGGQEQVLRNIPLPVVIRGARQDGGFIETKPEVNEDGMLELALDEYTERNLMVVRIEEDGSVYINPSNVDYE